MMKESKTCPIGRLFSTSPQGSDWPSRPKGLASCKNYIDFWIKKWNFSELRGLRRPPPALNPLLFVYYHYFHCFFSFAYGCYLTILPLPNHNTCIVLLYVSFYYHLEKYTENSTIFTFNTPYKGLDFSKFNEILSTIFIWNVKF